MKNVFKAKISGMKCQTLSGLYDQLGKALDFPDYFGKNLDALEECLLDLTWISEKEIVLTITDRDDFLKHEKPEKQEIVAEIFELAEENEGEKEFSINWKN